MFLKPKQLLFTTKSLSSVQFALGHNITHILISEVIETSLICIFCTNWCAIINHVAILHLAYYTCMLMYVTVALSLIVRKPRHLVIHNH